MGKERQGSPKVHLQSLDGRKLRFSWILGTALLCATFYMLGSWRSGGDASRVALSKINEVTDETSQLGACSKSLDFSTHHESADDVSTGVKMLEPCDIKYSEYTPCEDTHLSQRSLKFPRERLIYRERHCPDKDELLECLIPAPPKYTNPLPWPKSLDWAWFVNVPHKELTVEKAIQNWIQYEGDKFHFPGGGTMFPKGAGAYIDNINALIPLKDGSIRTALDTGCGVREP